MSTSADCPVVCTYECLRVWVFFLGAFIPMFLCLCMPLSLCLSVYVCLMECDHFCFSICPVYISLALCLNVRVCACLRVYMYMWTCLYESVSQWLGICVYVRLCTFFVRLHSCIFVLSVSLPKPPNLCAVSCICAPVCGLCFYLNLQALCAAWPYCCILCMYLCFACICS